MMSKGSYVAGMFLIVAVILFVTFFLIAELLGVASTEGDRQTNIRGLLEMLLVGVIFAVGWTFAYRSTSKRAPLAVHRKAPKVLLRTFWGLLLFLLVGAVVAALLWPANPG